MKNEDSGEQVIPFAEEDFSITKHQVETERVVVRVRTDTEQVLAKIDLHSEQVQIEHVPIGREVKSPPPMREENGVTIIPVLEEVLVVEKRLVLKEELHVRRVTTVANTEQPVVLRRQRVEIEHLPPESANHPNSASPFNASGADNGATDAD